VIRSLGFEGLDSRTAYGVWRLRQAVFVVEQASVYPDLDGRDLEPTTRHLVLSEDDVVVGYLRIVDDEDAARIGRVVVARSARGRGLADELMRAALAEVGDRPVRLDAQTGLAGWYASYGFEVSGPEFDDGGILHLPMTRPGGVSG
jgi:ElaA protein